MRLKKTVSQQDVSPAIWYAIGFTEAVFAKRGLNLVVTCLRDSHETRPTSLHNVGMAFDCRTRNIPDSVLKLACSEIKMFLDPLGYDLVLHLPPEVPHLHIEYQPKAGEDWQKEVG